MGFAATVCCLLQCLATGSVVVVVVCVILRWVTVEFVEQELEIVHPVSCFFPGYASGVRCYSVRSV